MPQILLDFTVRPLGGIFFTGYDCAIIPGIGGSYASPGFGAKRKF
jgi:hypothetical protein